MQAPRVRIDVKRFERAKFPFMHAYHPTIPTGQNATLKLRRRGASVVAKNDPGKRYALIKVWLEDVPEHFAGDFVIGPYDEEGVHFILPRRGQDEEQPGVFIDEVEYEDFEKLLQLIEDQGDHFDGDDDRGADGYLDCCIEATFDPERTDSHGKWIGSPIDPPGWINLRSIKITPPITSGGPHGVHLDAPGIEAHNPYGDNWVPLLRINGVWCHLQPIADLRRSKGVYSFGGRVTALCEPDLMDEIRDYQHDLGLEPLPNEPLPPRGRMPLRRLCLALRRSGRGNEANELYSPWLEDVLKIRNAVHGACYAQGQIDYYKNKTRSLSRSLKSKQDLMEARWRRAVRSGELRDVDEWVASTDDRYVRKWHNHAQGMAAARLRNNEQVSYMEKQVKDRLQSVRDAILRCEEREEKYADLIRYLYT